MKMKMKMSITHTKKSTNISNGTNHDQKKNQKAASNRYVNNGNDNRTTTK